MHILNASTFRPNLVRMTRRALALLIVLLGTTQVLRAQSSFKWTTDQHTVAANYGYGSQIWLTKVSYRYDVHLFTFEYHQSIFEFMKWNVQLVAFPQYNTTTYRPYDDIPMYRRGFEFGVNLGSRIAWQLFSPHREVYALVGVGPHYVSGVPQRQAKGFIFSDNFALGIKVQFSPRLGIDWRATFRHISNANQSHPNGGVNTDIFSLGIGYDF